jgi:hypothetical protein
MLMISPAELAKTEISGSFWSLPYHPLGEINVLDFYAEEYNREIRKRTPFVGMKLQTVSGVFMIYIAVRNFKIANRMILDHLKLLMSWCCLLNPLIIIVAGLILFSMMLG